MPTAHRPFARFALEALEAREVPTVNPFGPLESAGTFVAGLGALDVQLADFNADGKLDAAVTSSFPSTPLVTILPGNGNGTFGTPQALASLASGGGALALGDFNGDGRTDIAAVNSLLNQVVVHLNTSVPGGAISFDAGTTYGTFPAPTDIAIADIDGDGNLDLVTSSGSVISSLLLGAGNGTFGSTLAFATTPLFSSARVASADFDGDGFGDVVVTGGGSGVVLRNAGSVGNPILTNGTTFTAGTTITEIVVGDFNADGRPDIAVAEDGGSVFVLLNTSTPGTITFAPAVQYFVSPHPVALAAADVTGDGKLDLVVTSSNNSSLELLTGVGDGTFVSGGFADSTGAPGAVALGDLDGDGDLDAVAALVNSGALEVFASSVAVPAPPAPKTDVSFDSSSGNGTVRVLNADGSTRFFFTPYPGFTGPVSSAVGDVTGDDIADVFTAARGVVTVFNGATGERAEGSPFAGYTGAITLAAGDLTGDGVADLVVTAALNGNTLVYNGATYALIAQFNAFTGHDGPVELAIGDLNGDGTNELVAVARRPAGLQVNVYDLVNVTQTDTFVLPAPGGDRFSVAVTDPASGPGSLVVSSGGTVAVIDTQARLVRGLIDVSAFVPDVELDIMGADILVSAPLAGRTGVLRVSGDTFDVLSGYWADEPPVVG